MSGSISDDPLGGAIQIGPVKSSPTADAGAGGGDPLADAKSLGAPSSPLKVPYQNGKPLEQFMHGVGLGTRNVIEGVGSLPGMVADVATAIPRWGIRAAGGSAIAPSDFPVSDWLGLPKPQTDAENLRAEFIRGGASMLGPMGLAAKAPGLVSKIPALVRPLLASPVENLPRAAAQTLAGGVGAITGDAAAEDLGLPDFLKPTARMAGNVIGGVGINALTGGIERSLNALNEVKNPTAAALDRLGIKPKSAGQVSEGGLAERTERTLANTPVSEDILAGRRQEMEGQFGGAVDRTSRLASEVTNPNAPVIAGDTARLTAGETAQAKIRDWYYNKETGFPAQQEVLRKPVDDVMLNAPGKPVNLAGYRDALNRAATDVNLSSMDATQKAFANAQIQKWQTALENDWGRNGSVDWNTALSIKRQIGDARGTPDLINGIGGDKLSSIYAGIADDMGTAATRKGVGQQWENYNAFTTSGLSFAERLIDKVITGKNPNQELIGGEDAIKHLMDQAGSRDLQYLRLFAPEAADAVAAAKLREMGLAKAGKQGVEDTYSSATFLAKLRDAQLKRGPGTDALFSNPAVAQNVQDLAAAAERLKTATPTRAAPWVRALTAIPGVPRAGAALLGWNPTIAYAGAQRAAPPLVPGLLGGALVNQATGTPRYNIDVRPEDQR